MLRLVLFQFVQLLVVVSGARSGAGQPSRSDQYIALTETDQRIPRQPGCYCLRSSLHYHMCSDDFVIKAKIVDDNVGRGSSRALRGYQVLVKDIFNLPPHDKLKVGDKVAIYTPASNDFCGTSFIRRATYLMTGRVVDTILVVTSCDYSRKWGTVTPAIQKSLDLLPHKRHCGCTIFGCNGEICGTQDKSELFNVFETSRCATKKDTLQERCYEDYGQCRMSNRGQCVWKNHKKPKVCLNVSRRRFRSLDDST